ncbi:MAG: diguanylate cyclase [Alphaproteobacteria bacterium]
MIRFAAALLVYADGPSARTFHERLQRNSYLGPLVHSAAAALEELRRFKPDIVMIGPELADGDGMSLARTLKGHPEFAEIPVFLLAETRSDEIYREAMDIGVDDLMVLPLDEAVMFARMRPLVRIATMYAELRLRGAVARALGVDVRDRLGGPADDAAAVVLAVGTDQETAFVRQSLEGADVTTTTDLYQVEDMVSNRNYDVTILFAGSNPGPYIDLCIQTRNNARLFNLPVVIVMDPELPIERAVPYRAGASRVVFRPLRPPVVRSAVLPLVRRQRLRWALRQALATTLAPVSQDPLSDVYSRSFLMSYLADRIALAKAEDRHLSVVLFYLPSIAGIRASFGVEAEGHLLRQLSQWINNLLRAEDITARIDGYEFCVALPDTPLSEAQVVMNRIAGVLAHTDFAVPDVYEVVQVWLQVGATELGPDDTPETIIARARQKLE